MWVEMDGVCNDLHLEDLCFFGSGVQEEDRNSVFKAPLETRIHVFLKPPLFLLLPDLCHGLEIGIDLWCRVGGGGDFRHGCFVQKVVVRC